MSVPWRRRIAGLCLLVGLVLAVSTISPHRRQENTLIFRFDPDLSARVRRLSATWTPVGDLEPAGGFALDFAAGPGREVRHELTLADGDYLVSLRLEPAELEALVGETALVRRVTLSGADVVMPLKRLDGVPSAPGTPERRSGE